MPDECEHLNVRLASVESPARGTQWRGVTLGPGVRIANLVCTDCGQEMQTPTMRSDEELAAETSA